MKKIINYIKTHSKMFEIGFMLVAALTCVTTTFVMWITYGWFTTNDKSSVNGVEMETSNDNVHYRDYIKIERTLSNITTTSWYKRDSSEDSKDDSYYKIVQNKDTNLWDYDLETTTEGSETKSTKIPMTLTNIFPNEIVDVTIWYYPDESLTTNDYMIYLADLKDHDGKGETDEENFGRFYTPGATTSVAGHYHSVFGVFKTGELVSKEVTNEEDNTTTTTLDFSDDSTYLATYNGTHVDDTTYTSIRIKSGNFANEEKKEVEKMDDSELDSYYTMTFRMKLDLGQFNDKLKGVSTNKLSEKYIEIGAIRIIA